MPKVIGNSKRKEIIKTKHHFDEINPNATKGEKINRLKDIFGVKREVFGFTKIKSLFLA